MGVVAKGIQITRAVKNVGRLRQIVATFGRKGFGNVIERLGLSSMMPNRLLRWTEAGSEKAFAVRLRESFEELGPTFVKLGQILSMRPDLVPEHVIAELIKLQDNVAPLETSVVRGIIEAELKRPIDAVFRSFEDQPLAAASIGQVHAGVLLTGEEVVIKVQRPEIRKTIESDIALLMFLAELLEKYFPELRIFNPTVFVEEFFKTLSFELDYKVEANNVAKIGKNLESFPDVVVPKVHRDLSTHLILVQERLRGMSVNDFGALERAGVNRKKIATLGAKIFLHSVLKHGVFHGDLHGGNFFILPGDRLGIIDFGIVGRLSQRSRDQLSTMILALIQEDYETLCFTYAELGSVDGAIDFEGFQREVRNTLSPYLGLTLNEVNTGRVLIEATKIAAKYQIRVPADWMLVFKAIVTLEGLGRQLDPNFDVISIAQELVGDLVAIQYSPDRWKSEAINLFKDSSSLIQSLPRHARWWLRKMSKNDYAFEWVSPDVRALSEQIESGSKRMSHSFHAVALLISGALLLTSSIEPKWLDMPLIGLIPFVLGLLWIIRAR